LLWKHVAPSLSAGRCQIPSIRLVVEREDAILAFKTESNWCLNADWNHNGFVFPGTMDDSLDEESAINYMENVVNTSGTIIGNDVKSWSATAPPPLMTSTLQQQASALFGMNPKTTMMIAQRLYEAGHITYMRTDKAIISEEAVIAIKTWITGNYGAEFCTGAEKKKSKKADKSGLSAQEAHEAIRPTHIEVVEIDGEGASLYRLIWQRTIQSQMAAAQGESCIVKIDLDEFLWTSRWKRTTFSGWQIIGRVASIDDDQGQEEDDEKDAWKKAIEISVGTIVPWKIMKAADKETKAQGRYTEATLIRELEKHGIGRPSTFASLLATIQEKHYISVSNIPARIIKVKEHSLEFGSLPIKSLMKDKKIAAEKNKLIPTELGRSVLGFMLKHFDDMFNYDFTSRMEQRLDLIAEGKEEWKAVVHDTWMSYKERYTALNVRKEPSDHKERKEAENIGEWNGHPIEKKTGKFGDYLQCDKISIPFLMESLEETIQRFEEKTVVKSNERVFKEYVIRTGQYGPYIMKTSLKKPQFVSLARDVDISILTDKDVDGLYKIGLEQKKSNVKKYKK
jgi:DNA topoisomerase-1